MSHAELIWRKARHNLSPIVFEALSFLKISQEFGDVSVVAETMKKTSADRSQSAKLEAEDMYNIFTTGIMEESDIE